MRSYYAHKNARAVESALPAISCRASVTLNTRIFAVSASSLQMRYALRYPAYLAMVPHGGSSFVSQSVLATSYASIWRHFFAGSCVLEKLAEGPTRNTAMSSLDFTSARLAEAQVAWIVHRFECTSQVIGLRWADGVAAILSADFNVYLHSRYKRSTFELGALASSRGIHSGAAWLMGIGRSGRGLRMLISRAKRCPLGVRSRTLDAYVAR